MGPLSGAVATVAALLVLATPARAAAAVPYDDANVVGVLTLCDQNNQPIDHGNVATAPFVWAAVSPVAAPKPYDGDGRTATLFAYQPREGIDPGQWSGDILTATTRYSTPDHPVAKFTAKDGSLHDFVDSYPPKWDGYEQLRLYLGAPNQPAYTAKYAALDVRVTGDTWTAAEHGSAACADAQGTSVADLLPSGDPSKAISGAPLTTLAPQATPTTALGRAARHHAASRPAHGAGAGAAGIAAIGIVAAGVIALAVRIQQTRWKKSRQVD